MKFLLCCFLLLLVPITCCGKLVIKSPNDGRAGAVEFLKQTHQSLQSLDLGAFIMAVSTAAAYIPGPVGVALFAGLSAVGMLVTALSGNTHKTSPEMEALRKQRVKLDEIADNLKDVNNELNDFLRIQKLGEQRRKIVTLQEYWDSVVEDNEILKIRFQQMCRSFDFGIFPEYFRNELISHKRNETLAEHYTNNFDRKNYLKFAAATMLHFSEAVNLQYACTKAVFKDVNLLNYSIVSYNKLNGDSWNLTLEELKRVNATFENRVFDHVMSFVENYTHEHKAKNAKELFEAIYWKLSNKYYWKKWFLFVRDDLSGGMLDSSNETNPYRENKVAWYKRWDNLSGKTIILASSKLNITTSNKCPYNKGCSKSFNFNSCPAIIDGKNACYVCSGCNF